MGDRPELVTANGQTVDRAIFESLLRRRMFFTEAFEIYRTSKNFKGDNRGLYDYGPPGCSLQANIIDLWRKHFVLEENMLELDCTMLTPEDVFITSGHVAKFADWMCKDLKRGDYLRADHLIENVLEARLKGDKAARGLEVAADQSNDADAKKAKRKIKDIKNDKLEDATVAEYEEILAKIDNFNGEELGDLIKKYNIKNQDGNEWNDVGAPQAFNLMFQTTIGPSSSSPGYLRPETAQGQFLNFKKLLEFNQGAMPFASAAIGKSFRNEISPRSGLLRVREFLMAEIEHYVDPESGKKHDRFDEVKDEKLVLLDRHTQLAGKTTTRTISIGEAVETGVVDNETLGYFLVRVKLFLEKIGADMNKLRFRQHMANEMAHYAADCWDAELLTSYGWIECVGNADRSAYDLTVHTKRTGEALLVRETRPEPLRIKEFVVNVDRKKLGPLFKKDAKAVETALDSLDQKQRRDQAELLEKMGKLTLDVPGVDKPVELSKDLITIEERERIEHTREYVPNVIEPAFGIGRILYSVLEHVYWQRAADPARADNIRGVLSFPPMLAPTKVLVVPLSTNTAFTPLVNKLSARLRSIGVSNRVDASSVSIGRRYSRNDELGTPFGVTIDFDSVKDGSITLRERDTTKQVRASEDEIVAAIQLLVEGRESWTDVAARLPEFLGQTGDD